ncbi:MAG TPA: undecaprenyldiphospho-muramoylpentapeptide beta-N-acetylglucosaminyltransferase, partial [Chthoniobacterales bacterium]|nr:undecaprenyldiphospho-muramoylpentapeptide beta-N-acetylglucosaminyltransferase [Chthoniobacterales bacterium]
PGLAVAEVLRERGHDVLLFISEKEIDSVAVAKHPEFRFEKLPTIGLPSPFSPAFVRFLQRFNESLSACRRIYRNFQPQVVLGMGGFTSTAPILAGRMRKIPTFIHESNAIPGKANRMTARLVSAVLVGFKECAQFFPKVKTEVTGTPIRSDLARIPQAEARQRLGLREDLRTLLVMGGSQGAAGINQAMIKSLALLQGEALQVIHLTGARDERLVADNYQREKIPAYVAAFHHAMEEVYSAADFAIARSGAASLSELAAFGLASILIPYPYAAEDHQTRNAEIFTRADAAIMLRESEIVNGVLGQRVRELLHDPAKLQRMSKNCAALAPKDAADLVADTMERYTNA